MCYILPTVRLFGAFRRELFEVLLKAEHLKKLWEETMTKQQLLLAQNKVRNAKKAIGFYQDEIDTLSELLDNAEIHDLDDRFTVLSRDFGYFNEYFKDFCVRMTNLLDKQEVKG